MKNKLCTSGEKISLYYATINEKKLLYDMAMTPGIKEHIYWGDCKPSPWEEVKDKENEFYSGKPGKDNYLLIVHDEEIIGGISHSYNDASIENMEIDIWLGASRYTGKGFGSEAIMILVDYLNKEYNIRTYIMRPGYKNLRGIRAYEKCGFVRMDNWDSGIYYGDDESEWGDGDYGADETINMIKKIG